MRPLGVILASSRQVSKSNFPKKKAICELNETLLLTKLSHTHTHALFPYKGTWEGGM